MAMDDVIQSILDIDKKASDKLAEAEKNKLDAIKKATTEKNQMILDAEKSAEDEIRQIEKSEADKADARRRSSERSSRETTNDVITMTGKEGRQVENRRQIKRQKKS